MKKLLLIALSVIIFASTLTGCTTKRTTLENIKEKQEMTFAMTGRYPPFNFIDDNGELAGFDIDIANALAEEMGVKAVPITTAWDGIIGGLVSGRFDTIIGSMTITETRQKEVNFTEPYYYDGAQFFAEADSELTSIEDLENGRVGAVTGTTFHDALKEMENISEILQFESDVDNFMALEQGRSDGLVTGKFVGLNAEKEYGVELKPIGELLYAEDIAIAVRKEDEDFLAEMNAALAAIQENGKYEEISQKWFGQNILEK